MRASHKDSFPTEEQKDRAAMALDTLLPEKTTQCAACAKGSMEHLDTQACAVTPPQELQGRLLAEDNIDSEADMLSGISRKRNAHSSYY